MATRDLVSLLFTADDRQVQQALTRTDKGLDGLGGQAEKSGGRVQKSFSGAGDSVKGLAGRIPGVGGALSGLVTPAGAATAAIGLVVGGIAAAVGKVSSLEKELRPMIQRSNLSAESLQVLSKAANRLGSEDGLDGVTDSAQELQLRLAEASQDASGPAVAAFEKLGLSSADLIAASPEDSFLQVITALQGVSNASDKKFLADELLGGSSEKLSGIINTSSEEFQGLTDSIRENGDIVSNEGIASANEFNIALGKLGGVFGGIASKVGTAVIPLLTQLIDGVSAAIPILKDTFAPIWEALLDIWVELQPALADIGDTLINDLLPALQKIWNVISPVLIPVLTIFIKLLVNRVITTFKVVAGAISLVADLLTGDFAGAWESAQKIAAAVMNGIIGVYNNTIALIPGVSKIDMVAFADNVETSATDAEESISTSMDDSVTAVKTAGGDIIQSEKDTSKDVADEHQKRIDETKKFWSDMAKASADYRTKELAADLDQYGATNTEYKLALASLSTLSADHLTALQAGNDTASDHELAMQIIANKRYADEQKAADDAAVLAAKTVADDALAAEIAHRADLVSALDAHIDIIAENVKTANGDEKAALEAQIADLKQQRDAAYKASSDDRLAAAQAEIDAVKEKIKTAQGAELAALKSHQALLLAQYGAMVAGINAEIAKINPVLKPISGAGEGNAEFTQTNPDGSRQSGRQAPGPVNATGGAIVEARQVRPSGVIFFRTENSGNTSYSIRDWPERRAEAEAWIAANTPGAQHGAIVLPRTGGTRVNVGEGGEAEAIVPLPRAVLNAIRNGSGGASAELVSRLEGVLRVLSEIARVADAAANQAQEGVRIQTETARGIADQNSAMLEALLFVAGYSSGQFEQIAQTLSGELLPTTEKASVEANRNAERIVSAIRESAREASTFVPMADLAALAGNRLAGVGEGAGRGVGSGLGIGSRGDGREVVLALDGERLGSVFLDQFNILQSENRLLVDLV